MQSIKWKLVDPSLTLIDSYFTSTTSGRKEAHEQWWSIKKAKIIGDKAQEQKIGSIKTQKRKGGKEKGGVKGQIIALKANRSWAKKNKTRKISSVC